MRHSPALTRFSRLAGPIALAIAGLRCSDSTAPPPMHLQIVAPRTVLLIGGDTARFQLMQTVTTGVLAPVDASWSSNDTISATVDAHGLVTSRAIGDANIHARANGQDLMLVVNVAGHLLADHTDDSVVLRSTAANALSAIGAGGVYFRLFGTWRSADPAIATVDSLGTVSGVAVGQAPLWARYGRESLSVLARVAPVLTLTPQPDTVLLGDTLRFVVHAADANGASVPVPAPITWTSSNGPVTSVDAHGVMHSIAPGPALITAHFDWATGTAATGVTPRFLSIGLANTHACGLDSAGTGWCWNYPQQAVRLGAGPADSTQNAASANRIAGAPAMTDLGGGDGTGCGLGADGRAWCWSTVGYGNGPGVTAAAMEGPVGSFSHLTVGYAHRCLWNAGGAVSCWVLDQNVNLGQANDPAPHAFTTLTAAPYHTCGVEAGAVWCWGAGGSLRLGSQTTETACGGQLAPCSSVPLLVPGLPAIDSVSGGAEFTCALATDQTAYCWGSNEYGQLGSGDLIGYGYEFAARPVAGGLHFSEISTGFYHACGVTTGGDVYCWGQMWSLPEASVAPFVACADRYTQSPQRCYPTPTLVRGLKVTRLRGSHLQECGVRADHVPICWAIGKWQ